MKCGLSICVSSVAVSSEFLRVGIVDNDPCALYAVGLVLRHVCNVSHCRCEIWEETDPAKAVRRCCEARPQTDVILVDMSLGGISGVQVCRMIRRKSPTVGVIGITAYDCATYRDALIDAGAQALLDKSRIGECLKPAIMAVSRGLPYPENGGFMSVADSVDHVHHGPEPVPSLTAQELLVIQLDSQHLSIGEIAERLHISPVTVSSHRRNIRRKFNVHTWSAVVDQCREMHVI
ncbi:response regulator transcription factor [Bifidobacterium tissieri]|uniref:Response regulator transcription factor n=1 Tax=Bifidobacterium tissieri TaxID=1630162 RepID=A0A5N0A098_9BIFI|nr:response regulator transcription factor [Bifidobacterium tissieri]KAA8831059.1 response regulator transcription factor [Bifidobacterium tissieri]KAA8833286.1 response regulator transcription factor [Bifidobacterium tissieri]